MNLSLKTRVTLFITILVVLLGAASTFFFTVAHRRTAEREIVARGTALSQVLSRAAARGLVAEDLDLLAQASFVVQAPDVRSLQIFSGIWEPVDAYPFADLKTLPDPRAVSHFRATRQPFALRTDTSYEFYRPIELPAAGSPTTTIGYARLLLSTAALERAIRQVVFVNILAYLLLTLVAIVAVNLLVGRLIIRPLEHLQASVARFKNGHEMEDALGVAYRELERKNIELQKLDGMKDALIRDVTHELKTPVAKHAMQLELLRARLGEHCLGNVEQIVRVMERSVRRQQQVVRNLLDLSRLESGWSRHELIPVRLDEALRALAQEEGPLLEREGAELRIVAPAVAVRGHEELIWHVFSNLLGNAVKYRDPGRACLIRIEVAQEEGRVVVRVKDNGIGLTPEQRARAFERFYQADASREGAGVGLSICIKAVESMGGTIALESEGLGRGVAAVVRLHLAEPERSVRRAQA